MSADNNYTIDHYREQHKLRLSYMPWLYFTLKPKHREWADVWQQNLQTHLMAMETIHIGRNCFIAPEAKLFAEPGRDIVIGDNCYIAADAVLHGPITIGNGAAINHHVSMDGGRAGIQIGNHCRIAAYSTFYAFNHGTDAARLISDQPVISKGIVLGHDIWVGAQAGIVDGVHIADKAIIGMSSVVTRKVEYGQTVAGNPAKPIGCRSGIISQPAE